MNSALLLYHHPYRVDAPTILEHVHSFARHSRFPCLNVNVEFGFPRELDEHDFEIVILHYSLFGRHPFELTPAFLDYLARAKNRVRVAFFQDEHQNCPARFQMLNDLGVDAIYTILEPEFHYVYTSRSPVRLVKQTLTGFVSDDLLERAARGCKPPEARTWDVGYRVRQLPFWFGEGGLEKFWIAEHFKEHSTSAGLSVDIEWSEKRRIYGPSWYDFVADCRATLGAESGTSTFDLDGTLMPRCQQFLKDAPSLSFREFQKHMLADAENRISYRAISPRVFEAAAFRTLMIQFDGRYNGLLQPDVHYLCLERDFSNFDDVVRQFHDPVRVRELLENAQRDLIQSNAHTYPSFIRGFDEDLEKLGCTPPRTSAERNEVDALQVDLDKYRRHYGGLVPTNLRRVRGAMRRLRRLIGA